MQFFGYEQKDEGPRDAYKKTQILGWPGHGITVIVTVHSSSLIPPTGFSLSEDLGTTYSFILTEYDLDLRVLSSSYAGLKVPQKVGKFDLEIPSYSCYRLI